MRIPALAALARTVLAAQSTTPPPPAGPAQLGDAAILEGLKGLVIRSR